MTTISSPPRTPLHDQAWKHAKSGDAIYTTWRGFHLSVYRRRNSERLRFRLDGAFPVRITSTREAIGYLWEKLLRRLAGEGAA